MLENHIFVLPIVLVTYLPVSFIITYIIAVRYDHVEPGFPYISDTGTSPPESCIFGQLLNIGALLCSVVMYTRYKQIEKFYSGSSRKNLMRANKISFVLGITACLGVSIVGNFQETNVIIVHLIGAFLAFGIGGIYCYIQAVMSFRMTNLPGNCLKIRIFRVVLCILDLLLLIALFVSFKEARSQETVQTNHLKWTAGSPGYIEHLVSTISEWVAALLTAIFITTFTGEFRKFRLKAPEIIYSEIHEKSNKKMHISAITGPKVLDCDSQEELDKDMYISAITGPKVLGSDSNEESDKDMYISAITGPKVLDCDSHEELDKDMYISVITEPKVLDRDSNEKSDKDMYISAITVPKVLDSDIDKESN